MTLIGLSVANPDALPPGAAEALACSEGSSVPAWMLRQAPPPPLPPVQSGHVSSIPPY